MPLIKYRKDGDKTEEIMVDNNITVSSFIELVNSKSNKKVTKSVLRGKVLDDNDLIINYVNDSDQVLILLTNTNDEINELMDLEEEIKENKNIKEVKNIISSSLLLRTESKQNRRGFRYTFTIYTTATSDSMLHGNKMEFCLNDDYSQISDEIRKLVSHFPQVNYEFELYLFLPGGVYFKYGTLLDYYTNPNNISYDNIYAIVIPQRKYLYDIDDEINDPCSCCNPERNEILSPFCSSSSAGLTQISSFLGYIFYGGPKSEHILLSLAKVTRFAPLVVNLFRLILNRPLNVLNILTITAPLFTLFRSMLPDQIQNENVFEYTLNFLSIFDVIKNKEYLKFIELDTENEKDRKEMKPLVNYCSNTDQQQHVIIWTADTINPNFQSVFMKPEFSTIKNIFSTVQSFKPVQPLSLHYINYPTFVRGNDDKSVMLFIKEVPYKENFVSLIDPQEGNQKEMKIEELAKKLNCNQKDDIFDLIDPNQVDQIIFICFDEKILSFSDFFKMFVKKSHSFRFTNFIGLIKFGSEIEIVQQLTAISSDFTINMNEKAPNDKNLLYDSINVAQQQIFGLVKGDDGKIKYSNSRLRIIVITETGEDNGSEKSPESLINELIHNEIVVDTVFLSSTEKNSDCCALSKLTGGLCFKPKNISEGIEIFEQEAFLNIKMRHLKPLNYDVITSEIFNKEKEKLNNFCDSYSPNQMIINAKMNANLATPKYMCYFSMQKRIKTYRMMRSFIELNIISRNENQSFVVYSLFATPEEWRIFIKGPENSPYNKKWLHLYMVLPTNYPTDPPRFRFLTIPFHPNVSSEGTVVFSLTDKDYKSSLGIDTIIEGIIELLGNPDKNYPLNRKAMELYNMNENELKKIQENDKIGFFDYHEYLKDVKIYDEIPDDFVLPNEDRTKSKLITLSKEAVKEAISKGREVVDHCLLDINNYKMIEEIGYGCFGVVYLVVEKSTNRKFAAKVPKNEMYYNFYEEEEEEVEIIDYIKEVNVISIFNHGAITKMYGYCLKDFDNFDRHVIIMEYVPNGNLEKLIKEENEGKPRDGWDKTQKHINLFGIAAGMAYSVSYGITNSDLKPENILMTNELYPKITDFDSARLEEENNKQSFNMSGDDDIATPLYTAPEIIQKGDKHLKYAEKSDVYSYSIITYRIITSKTPFTWYKSEFKLYRDIIKGKRPEIPENVGKKYKELMQKCWNGDPNKRPTFQEIADELKADDFLNNEEIDRERFQKYVDYLKNYKESTSENNEFNQNLKESISENNEFNQNLKEEEKEDVFNQTKNITDFDLKDYKRDALLGAGQYGKVFKIENQKTGQIFAAKISLHKLSEKDFQRIIREAQIMKKLNHPSILKFIGFSPLNFENEPRPTIITEYSPNGSLQHIINKLKIPQWNNTKRLISIFGIVAGMAYLHNLNILHNDLKPSNILLDENFYPKICDFGFSDIKNDLFGLNNSRSIKGTTNYLAPEIINVRNYSFESDVYAFGILLYEIVFLKRAFNGMEQHSIFYRVGSSERPEIPQTPDSDLFGPIIKRCWSQNTNDRPTFNELMDEFQNEKYLTNDVDQNEFHRYVQFIQNYK